MFTGARVGHACSDFVSCSGEHPNVAQIAYFGSTTLLQHTRERVLFLAQRIERVASKLLRAPADFPVRLCMGGNDGGAWDGPAGSDLLFVLHMVVRSNFRRGRRTWKTKKVQVRRDDKKNEGRKDGTENN